MITLENIQRIFPVGDQQVHALRDINLHIKPGEYVSIMGPSGSGKSTLLNLLGLLDHANSGTYRLAGDDITSLSDEQHAQLRRERIGFVTHRFCIPVFSPDTPFNRRPEHRTSSYPFRYTS